MSSKKIISALLASSTILGLMFAGKVNAATKEEGVDVSSYQPSSASYFKTLKNNGLSLQLLKLVALVEAKDITTKTLVLQCN